MAEQIENLLIEHLKAVRNELQTFRSEVRAEMVDIKGRLGSIEDHVVLLHADIAGIHKRLDHHGERLERIDRRLQLASA
jgi:hypothetical protein